MKEQFRSVQRDLIPIKSDLTNQAQNPYSRGGENFMAEPGQTEGPPAESPAVQTAAETPHLPPQTVPPERVELVRRAWEAHNEGRTLDSDERTTQEMLIKMGIAPIWGGAEAITDIYTDPRLRGIVEEYNAVASSTYDPSSPKKPLPPEEIERFVERIENLRDSDVVDKNESIRLINYLRVQRRASYAAERRRREEERMDWAHGHSMQEMLEKREIRDEVFNNLFAAVDATPHEFFERAFNPLTYGRRYEEFMDFMREASIREEDPDRRAQLESDFARYQAERRVRQTLHDVNAILYLPSIKAEQLFDSMQQFSSDLGDIAYKTSGVRQMMDLYEAALREDMAKNDGYLRPEAVIGRVEKRISGEGEGEITEVKRGETEEITKARFKKLMDDGLINVRNAEGATRTVKNLKPWEIDRVFSISRGMMIMSQRLLSLAAESRLPKKGIGRFTSLFLQDVIQSYSPYIHLLTKYGITESGLVAYLYEAKEGKTLMDFLGIWDAAELEKVRKKFVEDPFSILDSPDKMRYLMLGNPNRAGDIFTWLSWRATEDAEQVSMTQDFLKKGMERMRVRLRERGLPSGVSNEEDYLNEYANWIGTGLRLERLRGDLSGDDSKKKEVAAAKAKLIIEQMVKLQPHRLYLVSKEIREGVGRLLTDEEKRNSETIINNFILIENAFLQDRERLLDEGKTFSTVTLDEFFSKIKDSAERAQTVSFAQKILADFNRNKERYWDEFIEKREYKHGFVLWSGDAPVDEFNASALGPTGGFARRARDNKAQGEATVEETKLLGNLRNIKAPEQVAEALMAIHAKIADYDAGKAKVAIAQKAEGIIKFFLADWQANIPVYGHLVKSMGRGSFAQVVYGKSAPVWHAAEARRMLILLKDKKIITDAQYKNLQGKVFATNLEVGLDVGSTMAQLIALALMLYLLEKVVKEK